MSSFINKINFNGIASALGFLARLLHCRVPGRDRMVRLLSVPDQQTPTLIEADHAARSHPDQPSGIRHFGRMGVPHRVPELKWIRCFRNYPLRIFDAFGMQTLDILDEALDSKQHAQRGHHTVKAFFLLQARRNGLHNTLGCKYDSASDHLYLLLPSR